MRIGIFGGSFDPVHLGHIQTARFVCRELGLDKLFMVVASDPPHKPDPSRLPGNIRYRMLDSAVKDEEKIFASDVELKREGKSYTVDTVRFFRDRYRGAELFLIVGGDMLENFPKWKEPGQILSMCTLTAVARPDAVRDMRAIANGIETELSGKVILSAFEGPQISSTEIRRRMYEAIPVYDMVARPTDLFMYENALYMPTFIRQIRSKLAERIKRKRLNHTMLTVREAIKLADAFGANTKKARLAAILHDCIKLPNKDLIGYCDENGWPISAEERKNPYLIHARLGAELAEKEYGVKDPEIIRAIRNHTLGCIGMPLLDKIIYVADKIEPTRDYEGLDEIRRIAYEDIDKAMLLVMQHSAEYTISSGRTLNPGTKAVMDHLEELINNKNKGDNYGNL